MIFGIWTFFKKRHFEKHRRLHIAANGLRCWPEVSSKFPGNIDLLLRIGRDAHSRTPGEAVAELSHRSMNVLFAYEDIP